MVASVSHTTTVKEESNSFCIHEEPMDKLQRQQLVNFGCVVAIASHVALYDGFQSSSFDIRSGQRTFVKQHLPKVVRNIVPIPDSKMKELVSTEKETFQVQS